MRGQGERVVQYGLKEPLALTHILAADRLAVQPLEMQVRQLVDRIGAPHTHRAHRIVVADYGDRLESAPVGQRVQLIQLGYVAARERERVDVGELGSEASEGATQVVVVVDVVERDGEHLGGERRVEFGVDNVERLEAVE